MANESTPPTVTAAAPKPKKKRAPKAKGSAVPSITPKKLEADDITRARAAGRAWDRKVRFTSGDYFVHATFGVGLVLESRPELIVCLFEGGETRKLIHAR